MKPSTYKAAIYRGIGSVEIVDLPYPECGDDDVIVKNLMAGVCGSDVAAYNEGGDANMIWKDHEFGHEMVSEVVEKGKNVKDIELGDYVFPNMGFAKRDRMRMATVGGFSEYIHMPQFVLDDSAFKLDKNLSLKTSCLLEPTLIGCGGAENLDPGPGKTAIVLGFGPIGMGAAIMLKWYGCDKVMVIDNSDYRLANAAKYDLITCNPDKEDFKAKAAAEFGSQRGFGGEACNANIYVDCIAPGNEGLDKYFVGLAGREATVAVVAVHHHPVCFNYVPLCYSNWHIKGCGRTTYQQRVADVLPMMQSGKFDMEPLVSHTFKLEQIEDALKLASDPQKCQKVAISYV